MRAISTALLVAFTFILVGCGSASSGPTELSAYRGLRHVNEAPAKLANAIRATVRVTGTGGGTGFFVNANGLLVTNNHVLGAQNAERSRCASEGCYVTLSFDHQKGSKSKQHEYFVTPVRASQSLDVAVFQVWEDRDNAKRLETPAYLSAATAVAPVDEMAANVIGHSAGNLKRWSVGSIYRVRGPFFNASNFSVSGNSGSPIVTDDGQLLGVLHHVPMGHLHVAATDIRVFSEGTTVAAVKSMILGDGTYRATPFPSVKAPRTLEAAAQMSDVYLLAHHKDVALVGGKTVPMLEVLGERCDAQLKNDVPVSDSFSKEHAACYDALEWINCRDPKEGADFKMCPVGAEKTAWQRRFDELAERAWDAHLDNPYQTAISALFFEKDDKDKERVHRDRLDRFLAKHRPPLSPTLAYYLLDAAVDKANARYETTRLVDYVLQFKKIRAYRQEYEDLIGSVMYLFRVNVIDAARLKAVTSEMLADKTLSLGDRLMLEEQLYLEGL